MIDQLTDDQLMQEIQAPSGLVPLVFLQAEAEKRARMRTPGYANGGQVKLDWRDLIAKAMDGSAFKDALANPDLQKLYGVDQGRKTHGDFMAEAGQYMPDRTSGVFGEITGELQGDLEKFKKSSKGRALMDMGLAMMTSKSPSFLEAAGAGGMAAMQTKDRLDAQQRGLMQAVLQAKMGQAQVQAQRDASLMGAATQMAGSQDQRFGNYANATLNTAQMAQQAGLAGAQIDASQEENALSRAAQLEAARISAGAQIQAAKIAASAREGMGLNPGNLRMLKDPKEYDAIISDEVKRITDHYYDKDGRVKTALSTGLRRDGKHAPTAAEIQRQAMGSAAQRMIMAGIIPPANILPIWQDMYVNGNMGQTIGQVATPGNTGNAGAATTKAPQNRGVGNGQVQTITPDQIAQMGSRYTQ